MTKIQEKNAKKLAETGMEKDAKSSKRKAVSPDMISIAPMLDWTDRHFRYFLRLICRNAMFYTEMTASPALILGDRAKLLEYNPTEHPLTLQVGGSEPNLMARCAVYAQEWGYKTVNINAGCPSSRVQSGRFGAILMQTPSLVADCVASMRAAVSIPVTVKTRISLNDAPGDGFENLFRFADLMHHAGCCHLIVHARQAKLNLSPKENRDRLPLHYELVYQLKKSFPDMFITINGNIKSLDEAAHHLNYVDGAMIGRLAYGNPYALSDMDARFFHDHHPVLTREEILERMIPYIEAYNGPKHHVTHHMLGLYHGQKNAKAYKQVMAVGDVEGIKSFLKSARQDQEAE